MTTNEKIEFKRLVKEHCIGLLHQRIQHAEAAMQQAQESANNEDKSSAGDKYETARAMGQLDSAMNAKQLQEAQRELQLLNLITIDIIYDSFVNGAVAVCNNQLFFMAVGLGIIHINDKKIIALSAQAPLSKLLYQKKLGDSFLFNGNEMVISEVY